MRHLGAVEMRATWLLQVGWGDGSGRKGGGGDGSPRGVLVWFLGGCRLTPGWAALCERRSTAPCSSTTRRWQRSTPSPSWGALIRVRGWDPFAMPSTPRRCPPPTTPATTTPRPHGSWRLARAGQQVGSGCRLHVHIMPAESLWRSLRSLKAAVCHLLCSKIAERQRGRLSEEDAPACGMRARGHTAIWRQEPCTVNPNTYPIIIHHSS